MKIIAAFVVLVCLTQAFRVRGPPMNQGNCMNEITNLCGDANSQPMMDVMTCAYMNINSLSSVCNEALTVLAQDNPMFYQAQQNALAAYTESPYLYSGEPVTDTVEPTYYAEDPTYYTEDPTYYSDPTYYTESPTMDTMPACAYTSDMRDSRYGNGEESQMDCSNNNGDNDYYYQDYEHPPRMCAVSIVGHILFFVAVLGCLRCCVRRMCMRIRNGCHGCNRSCGNNAVVVQQQGESTVAMEAMPSPSEAVVVQRVDDVEQPLLFGTNMEPESPAFRYGY